MTQTFVYAIYCPNKNEVKIGYATDPLKRLASLQTGTTDRLDVLLTFVGGIVEEKKLHDKLSNYRIGGEWFSYNKKVREELLDAVSNMYPVSDKEDLLKVFIENYLETYFSCYKTKKRTRIYLKELKVVCKDFPEADQKTLKATMLDLGYEQKTDASRVVFFEKI
jgi:hypothetical protein